MTIRVWIIVGEASVDYEGSYLWITAVYSSKEQAEEHIAQCKKWLKNRQRRKTRSLNDKCPFDRKVKWGDSGPSWSILEQTIIHHVDQYLEGR